VSDLHPTRWRASSGLACAAVIIVAPVLLVAALRLPLVNQLDYADAWFYSAYGWVPKHHFRLFDWNYFSVRFPPILAIGGADHLFGANNGYVLLRYALAVMVGGALFVGVSTFSTRGVALATTLSLYVNPFFSRMLLWDYTGFLAMAAAITGIGLWYWSDGRRPIWSLLAGIALSVAVFANALLLTAVFVLFAVEAIAAVRSGRSGIQHFAARLAPCALALVAVFLGGYAAYSAALGSLSPDDLLRPTIKFLRENDKNAAPYQQPVASWLFHEPRIWAPVMLSLALIATLRRRLLGTDLAARVGQFCVAYTAFLWVYRFAITSSAVETWWAYDFVVVATAPGVGVLMHELVGRHGSRRVIVTALAATLVMALLIRDVESAAVDTYAYLSTHVIVFMVALGASALAAALMTVARTRVAASALATFMALGVAFLYAPSVLDARGGTGIFSRSGDLEWRAYKAGRQFIEIVRDYDRPDRRVYLWYSGTLGLTNVAWTDLPQYGQTVQVLGRDESLDKVTPFGRARLATPTAGYVMVLSTRARDLADAEKALKLAGYGTSVVRNGALADRALHYSVIEMLAKP
jgi:hypothetical protein